MKRRGLRGTMGSHSISTAPCTWQRNPSLAYSSARTMPDLPSLREARTSWVLFPIEDTTPMPVTTTRLMQDLASHCRAVCLALPGAAQPGPGQHFSRRGGGLLARREHADPEVGRVR